MDVLRGNDGEVSTQGLRAVETLRGRRLLKSVLRLRRLNVQIVRIHGDRLGGCDRRAGE